MRKLLLAVLLASGLGQAQPYALTSIPCKMDGSNCYPYTGTVTSVGSGVISGLITASWATPTTTPALSLSLANQNANSFLAGPASGGIAGATTSRPLVALDLGQGTMNPSFGGLTVSALATPVITSVTPSTAGAVTWKYKVVAYAIDGTSTAASAEASTAASVTPLTAANYNRIVWAVVPNASYYKVFRTVSGGVPATVGAIGTTTSALTLDDVGQAGDTTTAPATATVGQALFANGVSTLPSVAVGTTGTGFYQSGGFLGISAGGTAQIMIGAAAFSMRSDEALGWTATTAPTGAQDTVLSRGGAAATLRLGAADTAAPVAQTLTFQGSRGATDSDVAGVDATIKGSLGTGLAASGKLVFKVGTPQLTGTAQHVAATALTLQDTGVGGVAAPQALFADGTAAKPSIGFTTRVDSGISFIAGSSIVATTSEGVQSFGVDKYGRILIPRSSGAAASGLIAFTNGALSATPDAMIISPTAATIQLGNAAAASPVSQTLTVQGSRGGTDTDTAGQPWTLRGSLGTGTGIPGAIVLKTGVPTTTGSVQHVAGTRYYISATEKVLTLGSNTNFVRVDFPASGTISVAIGYNITVTDTATPPEFKANGGRYYFSAYRKSTGNAAANTVVETGDNSVQSVGNALTDTMTITGDANGVLIGINVAAGTGLTGTPVGTINFEVHIHGSVPATVTPQ